MIYTRRILLTLMGLGALGIAIPACRNMLGQILFSPQAPQVPPPPPLGNPFTHGSKSLVVMVHGTEVPAMVERAIELLGGPRKLPLTGTRTLLKPNMVDDCVSCLRRAGRRHCPSCGPYSCIIQT